MTSSDEEFHQWLLATFREEADEILTGIVQGLVELEKAGAIPDPGLVEQIFRKTHSLKGAARAVDLRDIELVCQNVETVFSLIKKGELIPDPPLYDLLHASTAVISAILSGETESGLRCAEIVLQLRDLADQRSCDAARATTLENEPEKPGSVSPKTGFQISTDGQSGILQVSPDAVVSPVIYEKTDSLRQIPVSEPMKAEPLLHPQGTRGRTVRISAHKLDRLISGSDDLLSTRLFITHRMRELEGMMSAFSLWRWNHSQIEGDISQIRDYTAGNRSAPLPPDILQPLEHIIEYLKFDRDFVTSLQHDLSVHIRATEVDRAALESSTNEISDLIHDAVLVPVSTILSSFSKFVRDYSRSAGKKVDLLIEGDEIEMDRRILESIKTPLMHLIHNSIDHGIEYPDIRKNRGKPESGRLHIRVSTHSGGKIAIEVIDDGTGIDRGLIRKVAVEKGVISEKQDQVITDDEALWLIFRSGLSTNTTITDLSGRGLGLAIVDDTVTRLGGELKVWSDPMEGTSISIILPVRLATLRGLVVRSGSQTYVFPIQQVKKVIRLDPALIYNRGSRISARIDGEIIRIYRLSEILEVPDTGSLHGAGIPVPLVTLEYAGRQIACMVDEVIRVQEIVIRPLGRLLRSVKRITGAVILGDGSLAMVLDPLEIIVECFSTGTGISRFTMTEPLDKHILVVDDSATSRALIRRTLELSGYQVHTAHDGMDAFAKLREYSFDMIVSDVDMPRMSGYTLTEKIRSDDRFSHIPVLLVTSLDSAQDREYGKMVGADAYIVKSQFEKSSLLKTIHTLIYKS